ncbi:MAG: hypothetical protein JST20_04195, partial [Bacteroidetes bacterium]|nr:hypothetical protein [Bacteroidota bacterium]
NNLLPNQIGNSGKVLQTDGTNTTWVTSYSGLANFTESVNTTAPNSGKPVVQLIATNAASNVDIAMTPKGLGSLTAQIADNTITGGNKRGNQSVDWQMLRASASQVASGTTSYIGGGSNNTASGTSSTVVAGNTNAAIGSYSFIGGGYSNTTSGTNDVILGGSYNTTSGSGINVVIGGGVSNSGGGSYTVISGGGTNSTSGNYSTVSGGNTNVATGNNSTITGGAFNNTYASYSSVLGGSNMTINTPAGGSLGYNSDTTGGSPMSISTPKVVVFANNNLWLANNTNSPSELRFYEAQNSGSSFPAAITNFTSFKAGNQSADISYVLPLSQGSSNTYLKNDGSGNLSWASSGLINFTESVNNSAPNGGIPVVQLTPNNAGGSVDIAIAPKGQGALLAQIPDNTAAGGNKRGSWSVDFQIIRSSATQVVSGSQSFLGSGGNNTVSGSSSALVGGYNNTVSGNYSFVGGGYLNNLSGGNQAIVGGERHTMSGSYNFIGGGYSHTVSGNYNTISGGNTNLASGNYSTVGGGTSNGATGNFATVGGGSGNTAQATGSVIPGGTRLTIWPTAGGTFGFNGDTTAYGMNLTVPGLSVFGNTTLALGGTDGVAHEFRFYEGQSGSPYFPANATINYTSFKAGSMSSDISYTLPTTQGGTNTYMKNDGSGNLSWATPSSLANFTESVSSSAPNSTTPVVQLLASNGATNVDIALTPKGNGSLSAQVADNGVGGGNKRGTNSVDWQTLRTSASHVASGISSTICGGYQNTASNNYSTVGGGNVNLASGNASTVAGGNNNTASNSYATVAGGNVNTAGNIGASIGGGYSNSASNIYTTISGGYGNSAISSYGSVGGGTFNNVQNSYATIAGGRSNVASGVGSFVGGGGDNGATTAGNTAGGIVSAVLGGYANFSYGDYSSILGGRGLTLSSSALRSVGFHSNNSAGSLPMTIDAPDVAVFGNTNLWLANNKNVASEIRFYEAQNTSGSFPAATINYTAFKAGVQSADITYTLPTTQGSANSIMTNDGSGGLSWGKRIVQLLNQTVDCANLTADGGTAFVDVAVTGAAVGSTVYVSPRGDMEDGIIVASARVSAADNVRIKFVNSTNGAINPAAVNFDITVIQP